ncbi:MAG TPA: hypothetical protein VIJ35_13025 [Bradyrhizobium sp.]|jgi:hypothetical protein
MTDQVHLVVATPCFGGQVSSIYAGSIFRLQPAVRSMSNIDLKVLMRDGEASSQFATHASAADAA